MGAALIRQIFFSVFITLCAAAPALAQTMAETTLLTPGRSVESLEERLVFLDDAGQPYWAVTEAFEQGRGHPSLAALSAPDRRPEGHVWALVWLENGGAAEIVAPEAVVDEWIFAAETFLYGLESLEAYLVRPGRSPELALSFADSEPFDSSKLALGRVRSEFLRIKRGERVGLLLRFKFNIVITQRMSLETEADFNEEAASRLIYHSVFYCFSLSIVLGIFVLQAAFQNLSGMAFVTIFLLGLSYIAYSDGLAFRFVYPEAPEWHIPFGNILLNLASCVGFLAVGYAQHGPTLSVPEEGRAQNRRPERRFAYLALLPVGILLSSAFVVESMVTRMSYWCVLVMVGVIFIGVWRWRFSPIDHDPGQATRFVVLIATPVLATMVFLIFIDPGYPLIRPSIFAKLFFIALGLVSLTVLTVALIKLRRRHFAEVELRLSALAAEAAEARARLNAEQAYTRARDLAQLRQRQLAAASHDIRQPLAALRLEMRAAAERLTSDEAERLNQSLDYLHDLSARYLAQTRPSEAAAEARSDEADPTRPYPIALILDSMRRMFTQEAVSKGLALRVAQSSVEIATPPLLLMRIVGNLVANAVKFTESGGVLVGVRRRGEGAELWVVDTGPGLTADEQDRYGRAYVKGERSEGEGLGLAICHDLAAQEGLQILVASTAGRGTVFRVVLPAQALVRAMEA